MGMSVSGPIFMYVTVEDEGPHEVVFMFENQHIHVFVYVCICHLHAHTKLLFLSLLLGEILSNGLDFECYKVWISTHPKSN